MADGLSNPLALFGAAELKSNCPTAVAYTVLFFFLSLEDQGQKNEGP
jgi:hypothetical protein